MAYFVADVAMDTKLQYLKDNVTLVVLTVGVPTSYANANTNNGTGSGQKCVEIIVADTAFTLADDATDGRKVTVAAQSSLTPVANGTVDHWAWLNVAGTALLAYGSLGSSLAVTTGDTVSIPAHYHVDRDATAIV